MAETSFHRFHMCKRKNKHTNTQTYKCITHILTPLLLFLIQLRLYLLHPFLSSPIIVSLSLWFLVLSSFFIYAVVDVIERTPDYSSNWDWSQLFQNISMICYLKVLISCYNILYREICSILLSCCWCRCRSFILYLRIVTLDLQFWHAVFKHL